MTRRRRQPSKEEMDRLEEMMRAELEALRAKSPDAEELGRKRRSYYDKIMFQKSVKRMGTAELLDHLAARITPRPAPRRPRAKPEQ